MRQPVIAYGGQAPQRLMHRLRRVGALYVLMSILLLSAVHWLAADAVGSVRTAGSHEEAVTRAAESAGRLDLMLAVAGLAMLPALALAAATVRRYVRGHHLEELAEASFRKSQFVALATAELRNPLNAMAGFADLLMGGTYGALPPDQTGAVREIRNAAGNMKRLLNDILDQSNIEARRIELTLSRFDAADALRDALTAAAPLATRRGVVLTAVALPGTGIVADRGRLKQVMLNLVLNALNASAPGSEVEARVVPGADGVELTVTDHGTGISPSVLPELLEHVQHVRSARSANEGTGLDLAICRHLVELHGGRLWAHSEPGRGSRFHVVLPAAPSAATSPVAG